jgi:hypothetical protein
MENTKGPLQNYFLIVEKKFARHNDPESDAGWSVSSW